LVLIGTYWYLLVFSATHFLVQKQLVHFQFVCFSVKYWNILSFDGGGTKGVMEAKILEDIMNMTTLICDEPEKMTILLFKDVENYPIKNCNIDQKDGRKDLMRTLDEVKDPIHPTDVFDVICGTSTGALIAFGLVGGKAKPCKGGTRQPMSVKDVIEMYKCNGESIFPQSKNVLSLDSLGQYFRKSFSDIPLRPHSQDGVKKLLLETFNGAKLGDINHKDCIAACVAREFNEDSNNPNALETFDSKTNSELDVVSVLKATSDAPLYFVTPTEVNGKMYIDGGVGGNCPLTEVIKRSKEIAIQFDQFDSSKIANVLSIAPPLERVTNKLASCRVQFFHWLQWFPSEMTNGYSIFKTEAKSEPEAIFQRIMPKSEASSKFKMDSSEINAMIEAVEDEGKNDATYLKDVLNCAIVIAMRHLSNPTEPQLLLLHYAISHLALLPVPPELKRQNLKIDELLKKCVTNFMGE
jgi:predicted acylesterase/phospholipase RssA